MRFGCLIVLATVFCGCGDETGQGGNDLAARGGDLAVQMGGGDMTLAVGDLAGTGGDGGLATDGGAVGAMCQTACDCMPGLGCFGGKCTAGAAPVYCCGVTTCPAGRHVCQNPDGSYGQCGGGGAFDLGGFDYCSLIDCSGANGADRCTHANCTQCIAAGNRMTCAK